jgi:hypothetical protein
MLQQLCQKKISDSVKVFGEHMKTQVKMCG